MAADPENEAAEPTQVQVADPEEFNQTERLRSINQVREQAGKAFEQTMVKLRDEPEFYEDDRRQILRAAVMRYLTDIEWLVHKAGDNELLAEIHLGDVVLEPPEYLVNLATDKSDSYPRVVGSPDIKPQTWSINGFNDFLTAQEAFSATWSISVDTRHDGPTTVSESVSTFMPAHVSFNAFRMANQFLADQGIDIDLSEDNRDAKFEYTDILEEGPPGEGEAPEMVDGGDD